MVYQWYPGHMTKARRAMQEDIADRLDYRIGGRQMSAIEPQS